MPEPIDYRILLNLQAALAAIAVAGGYHYTVAATAVKLDPNHGVEELIAPDGPRPFIILELTHETWEYVRSNDARVTLRPTVHWVSDSTPANDESRLQTFLRGCADVEMAIAVDVARGALAVDTKIVKRTFETAVDGAQVWAMVDLEIPFYKVYGQPNG